MENNCDMKIVQTTAECNTDVSISNEVSIFQLSGQTKKTHHLKTVKSKISNAVFSIFCSLRLRELTFFTKHI